MKAYGNGFTIVAAMHGVDLPDPNRRLHIPTPRTPSPTPTPPSAPSASSVRTDSGGPLERPDPPAALAPPALPAPLACEGCGLPVAVEYTARTGRARHGCCPPITTTTSTPAEAGVDAGLAEPAATRSPA